MKVGDGDLMDAGAGGQCDLVRRSVGRSHNRRGAVDADLESRIWTVRVGLLSVDGDRARATGHPVDGAVWVTVDRDRGGGT